MNEILDRLHKAAEGERKVSIGHIVDALGDRGYGPLLFVPALIDISPIGDIPALPSILALIMALIAVHVILDRKTM